MTLVARFEVSNSPVLLGDLLISGSERPGADPLKIPTIDDIAEIYPEDWEWHRPNGLKQKIAIISDRLAVGWAGKEISATVAINKLREHVLTHGDELDKIREFVESPVFEEENRTLPFSLTGYAFNDHESLVFAFGCENVDIENFGRVSLMGTGASRARKIFDELASGQFRYPNAGEVVPAEVSKSPELVALMLSGHLISSELIDNASLVGLYGGGYEIAYIDSAYKFAKLDGVIYAIWGCYLDGESSRHGLYQLNHYRYIGDVLLVSCVRFDVTAATLSLRPNRPGEDINYYSVYPIWKRPQPDDRAAIRRCCDEYDFAYNYLCSFVPFIRDDGNLAWVGITQGRDPSNPGLDIHINRETKELTVQFSQDYTNMIVNCIERETSRMRFNGS